MNNFDFLCISESRLKTHHNMRKIPGYDLYRKDAKFNSSERGVAIYVRSIYKVKIMRELNYKSNNVEYLSLTVQLNYNKSFIVSCVYRHPNYSKAVLDSDYLFFEEYFTELSQHQKIFYVLGDFNLRDNKSVKPFNQILQNLSLKQIIDVPTRGDNILDFIVINDPSTVISKNVSNPHISDHAYVQCEVTFKKVMPVKKVICVRNFKKISIEDIINTLSLPINNSVSNCVENDTSEIVNAVLNCFNQLAPERNVTFFEYPLKKFISPKTKQLMMCRNKAYELFRQFPTAGNKGSLAKLKKEVKKLILSDSKTQFNQKVEDLHLWGAINKLFPLLQPTAEVTMDPDIVNNFFVAISTRETSLQMPQLPTKPNFPWNDEELKFQFKELTEEDVRRAWIKSKNRNSTSTDDMGLSNKMLNYCMVWVKFREVLTDLFNFFISSGTLPKCLKLSKVIPIPKKCESKTPNDLRPISLQPVLAKLFGKLVFDQLYSYFELNNFFSKFQFGCRKLHSTTHALLAITEFIYTSLDNNRFCILVTLDIMKAYDKSCREVLLHKLKWYGVDEAILKSFLSQRNQFVCIKCNNIIKTSDTLSTNVGVPQGLCLSCLLFLVMMNDLPLHIRNSLSILFCDDTGLMISGTMTEISNVIQMLENDLLCVVNWMSSNRQVLNGSKCELVVIASKKNRNILSDIVVKLDGIPLKKVKSVKILGLEIDEELNFRNHCSSVVKKCNSALWTLGPLKYVLGIKQKSIVVQALVMSILKYACPVWLLGKTNLNCIDRVIRQCARFVLGINKYDSLTDYMNVDLEWLNVQNLCKFEACKLFYKFKNNIGPAYFNDFAGNTTVETRRTRQSIFFEPQIDCNKGIIKKSFQFRSTKIWFDLPESIQGCVSSVGFDVFKKLTKNYLINKQCEDRLKELFLLIDEHEHEQAIFDLSN